jgi:hypothetical protein
MFEGGDILAGQKGKQSRGGKGVTELAQVDEKG